MNEWKTKTEKVLAQEYPIKYTTRKYNRYE